MRGATAIYASEKSGLHSRSFFIAAGLAGLFVITVPNNGERYRQMINKKFIVKVNRSGARYAEYVQRIDRTPIQTTPDRKLALVMGRFTAEDAIKSIQHSRCSPQLVCVYISA